MAEKKVEAKKKKARTKEEGTIWISSTGAYYEEPEITAEILHNARDNVYGRGLSTKLRNLIFRDKYTLEVLNEKGESDEEREKRINQICDSKSVRMWTNMQRAYMDIVWYGISLFNPVWNYEGSEYILEKLRHLPASTFADLVIASDGKIYSQILQGITLNENNEIEFWQTDEDGTQTQLENVFYVKDPVAEGLAGESIMAPLVPIIEMIKFTLETIMQQANRTGAKILFIKVTSPQGPSSKNGGVGDVEYANLILQKWGKDRAFQLRENMDIVDPGIRDDSSNLEVKKALEDIFVDYIIPTSFISREGGIFSGSETSREELLNKYIEGIHQWLEDQFEMLLNRYLEYNEYTDYTVHINIPAPSIDRSELELRQAEIGSKTKSLTINEMRKKLGEEELSEEAIEELIELHTRLQPPKTGGFERAVMETITELKKETPVKVERTLEESLKEAGEKLSEDIIRIIEEEEE